MRTSILLKVLVEVEGGEKGTAEKRMAFGGFFFFYLLMALKASSGSSAFARRQVWF